MRRRQLGGGLFDTARDALTDAVTDAAIAQAVRWLVVGYLIVLATKRVKL